MVVIECVLKRRVELQTEVVAADGTGFVNNRAIEHIAKGRRDIELRRLSSTGAGNLRLWERTMIEMIT